MAPKKLGLVGLLVAFLVALPIFVWSIVNLNFNPKEKAQSVNNISLSICGEPCGENAICSNSDLAGQKLVCYSDKNVANTCRNENCLENEDCICPMATPIIVNCNQTCNTTTNPSKICTSGLICKTSGTYRGEDGVCRKQECDSETDCDCSTPKPTATATATSTPTQTPGIPNYCGGTCGSNFNCQANYYCHQGFCRNPVCPSDSNCDCIANVIATATPKKTATSKPSKTATTKATSTATAGGITNYKTQSPKITATSSLHPALVEKNLENQFLLKYALPIFGIFALVVISTIFYALKKTKKQDQIPHITPPVNI